MKRSSHKTAGTNHIACFARSACRKEPTASIQAAVSGTIIALLLLAIATGYLFWAKITVAWPFSP
jgi:hypothetical protein